MYEFMDSSLKAYRKFMVKQYENYKLSDKSLGKTKKLYEALFKALTSVYLRIVRHYYRKAGGKKKKYDEDWLFDFLLEFDPITGYQFTNEWERKMYRQYEEAQSAKQTNYFGKKPKSSSKKSKDPTKHSMELLNSQITQKAIETADYGTIEGYKETGIKKVLWVAQLDHKTCDECLERNGKIFSIDEIPEKHYNCRCILKAVRED